MLDINGQSQLRVGDIIHRNGLFTDQELDTHPAGEYIVTIHLYDSLTDISLLQLSRE